MQKRRRRSSRSPTPGPQRLGGHVSTTTIPKTERLQKAGALALKEAVDRFNHELMSDEERMVLLDRIKRLRKSLAL